MNKIYTLILKSCKNTRYLLLLSLVFNIVLMTIFLMLGTGIENVTNESLSTSDYNQLMAMISSIIFVSLISIVFLQWLTSLIIKTIIDNRRIDTVNFQLLGIGKSSLISLYFKELFITQIIGAIIGLPLSILTFYFLSKSFELDVHVIPPEKLLISLIIYVIITSFISLYTIVTEISSNPINKLRQSTTNDSPKKVFAKYKPLINRIFGIGLILTSLILILSSNDDKQKWLLSLLIFPIVFFMFDDIIKLMSYTILRLTYILKSKILYLSEKLSVSHAKKTKISLIILVFSCSFYLGLYTCFETIRDSGRSSADLNIKYQNRYIYDEFINDNGLSDNNIYLGLRFKSKTASNSIIYVNGIDEKYAINFENIRLDSDYFINNNDQNILSDLNRPDYNGIIMPNMFITKDDIGKEITLTINDKAINFIVVGACYVNNFGRNNTYVSQSYLRKELNLPIESNVVYTIDGNSSDSILKDNSEHFSLTTKEDIVLESYTRSVHGTELPEITAFLVLFCSILITINNIFINSRTDLQDISKFRAIGYTNLKVYYLYLGQNYLNIIKSAILVIPLSLILSMAGVNLVLKSGYIANGIVIPWVRIIVVFIGIIISITISVSTIIKKCDHNKLNLLLRSQH